MKILFQTRFNLLERKGGDTIQILKTKEYIEKNFPSIEVDINNNPNINLQDYDLVHIFNLLRPQEVYLYIKNAKAQGKKVILSTIYWKSEEFEKKGQYGYRKIINNFLGYENIERCRMLYRYLFDGEKHSGSMFILKNGFEKAQKYILENVDLLLPNGEGEINLLKKELNLARVPNYNVVPNAIDESVFFNARKGSDNRDLVLCVGRIEPRKNQLNLVKAFRSLPYKLIIVGKAYETQQKYYKKVKNIADEHSNITIIDEMDQKELSNYYRRARVHVLPSWYDTPGLVSLEAAVNGCIIVVTNRGTTREYFGDCAFYCEPDHLNSIASAIRKAFNTKNNYFLKEKILNNYTWDKTAEETVKAYRRLIK